MIALIALGHSPRPDHEEVYEILLPGVPRKLLGALDAFSCDEARKLEDKQGVSPLVCLLNDKTTVEIPLPVLFPYIERQIEVLAVEGADLAVVLCCGGFPRFNSSIPVLLPGMIVPAVVKATFPAPSSSTLYWGSTSFHIEREYSGPIRVWTFTMMMKRTMFLRNKTTSFMPCSMIITYPTTSSSIQCMTSHRCWVLNGTPTGLKKSGVYR